MTPIRTFLIPPVLLGALLLGACGGDDDTADDASADTAAETSEPTATAAPSDDAAAGAGAVTIERSRFAPEVVEVAAGTTVTFENLDPYAHTVTSADGSPVEFDSGEIAQDQTFEQTFDEAGTYGYFCEIHPTMTAEVVVS
ncbi:MAG: cupredoxin domain-containing protein [Acidimicrobiia bacterium]